MTEKVVKLLSTYTKIRDAHAKKSLCQSIEEVLRRGETLAVNHDELAARQKSIH